MYQKPTLIYIHPNEIHTYKVHDFCHLYFRYSSTTEIFIERCCVNVKCERTTIFQVSNTNNIQRTIIILCVIHSIMNAYHTKADEKR